jgi:pimeloyl-ACP methyl ester carboxylesterase
MHPNPKAFIVLQHLAGGKMNCPRSALGRITLCFFLFVAIAANAQTTTGTIVSRTAQVNGLKLHYLTAGNGPAVILLHGYTQTSRMWRPLIPQLSGKFTVIAPDLPGIGDSDIAKDGLDMKNAAIRIHALAESLHVGKARVVGHDIGLMVAYAYAAMYPNEVEKLVVMDAFLPGVPGWEPYLQQPEYLAFSLSWADTGSTGSRAREDVFRLVLE